ncbi:MAG: GNAT family N-acetyltransferase [Aliishimia sp.]
MTPQFRPAQHGDAAALAALSIQVWIGTYLKRGIAQSFADYALATYTTAHMEALIADPRQLMIVSLNEDGLDGYVRATLDASPPEANTPPGALPGPHAEIATLYVQPRHHGTGRGTGLLAQIRLACRARGMQAIWLTTNSENTPAIAFYHAYGFTHLGQTKFWIGEDGYPNDVFGLTLTPVHTGV